MITRSRLTTRQGGLLGHGLAGAVLQKEQTLVQMEALDPNERTVQTTAKVVQTAPLIAAAANNVTTKTGSIEPTQSRTSTVSDAPSRWAPAPRTYLMQMQALSTPVLRSVLQGWQRNYDASRNVIEQSACQSYITVISRELSRRAGAAVMVANALQRGTPSMSINPDVATNVPEQRRPSLAINAPPLKPILTKQPIPIEPAKNVQINNLDVEPMPLIPPKVLQENIALDSEDPNVSNVVPNEGDLLLANANAPMNGGMDPNINVPMDDGNLVTDTDGDLVLPIPGDVPVQTPPVQFPWMLVLLGAGGLLLLARK